MVERVDNVPQGPDSDGVIRYLRMEVEAIIRAERDDDLGRTTRVLYLVATMTGLRLGERRALRWENVDFAAQRSVLSASTLEVA